MNLVLNPNMTQTTSQEYEVLTSDCVARTVHGKATDPMYYFYLGGCDYPNYPNGLPAGITMSSFEYAGGGLTDDSVDNDPLVSKSIMLDASNPLTNFGDLGRQYNPTYGGSGGVTQVVYIGQTAVKPFRFSCYCKCEDVVGNARVLFDVVGFDNTGSGTYLQYVSGTHDFAKMSELKSFNFPVKYAFLHFSVQAMSSGKAWFAKPLIEEVDMELIIPDANERVINPIFAHTSNETDTVAWNVVNCERFEDVDLIYLNPYLGTLLRMTDGGSIKQNVIPVHDIPNGIIDIKFTVKSLGNSIVKVTVTERGRHRNQIDSKSLEFSVASTDRWKSLRYSLTKSAPCEKIDLVLSHVSGDDVLICAASVMVSAVQQNIISSGALQKAVAPIQLPVLPDFDTTLVCSLPEEIDIKYLETALENTSGTMYLTNGILGSFIPYQQLDNYQLIERVPLTKLTDNTYSPAEWNENVIELGTSQDLLRNYVPAPHLNETEDDIDSSGGQIPAGDRRYYCVTSYNEYGESTKSNDIRYLIPEGNGNTNRIYLEITPAVGARGYRIYMSHEFDNNNPNKPGDYDAYGADYIIWGDNALLDTITNEQLREGGYRYWDDGSKDSQMQPGTPSMTVNTAKHWIADSHEQKILLTSTYFKYVELWAGCLISDYQIRAVKYLQHSKKVYLATDKGVFESDDIYKGKLYKISDDEDVYSLFYSVDGLSYGHSLNTGHVFANGNRYEFNWTTGILTTYQDNNLINTATLNITGAVFDGFAIYYDKFITHNKASGEFIAFDASCNVVYSMPFILTDFAMWDLSGSILSILTHDNVIKYFGVCAGEYYAKLDSADTYPGTYFPPLAKPRLPDEPEDLGDEEVLVNGTFNVWNGTNTAPEGFNIIYDTGTTVNVGASDIVAVKNTKTHVYKTLTDTWASIYKQDVVIEGYTTYTISFYVKASVSSSGSFGVRVKDAEGAGGETWHSFECKSYYEKRSFDIVCGASAVAIDFRIFYYGKSGQEISYYTNALSVKWKEAQELAIAEGELKSKLRNFKRPRLKDIPLPIRQLYIEWVATRTRKPIPRAHERIGTWEVFRRSVVSPAQTEDYDMHWAENSAQYASVYPRSLYLDYYDYLSFYPTYGAYREIVNKRNEWRCVEPTGVSQPFGDGRAYYNWKDPECRQWYTGRLLQRTHTITTWSDGTYLDDFWGEGYDAGDWDAKASWLLNYNSVKERLELQAEGLRLSRQEYRKRGMYFCSNYGDTRYIDYSGAHPDLEAGAKVLAENFDGYLREVWLYGDLRPPQEVLFSVSRVRDEIEFLRYCNRNNKFVACLAGQRLNGYDARIFALAAFLMGKGDYCYFAWRSWDFTYWHYGHANHQTILPEQSIYLGEAKSEYVYDNKGFFSREFDNCVALLNVGTINKLYTLPDGTWYTTRGESFAGSVTVVPQKAYILVKERP